MAQLSGKALVAQSGGPTTVINSSLCGVIEASLEADEIDGVYGAHNGVLGVLTEDLFDITKEKSETISGLRRTPSAAAGSCRYKLKSLDENRRDYDRILEVFKAHNIRYFFYIGGNDSMDTADKVAALAAEEGYHLRVMGVPKTIDNDLAETDHTPGYGSEVKYLATTVMESGRDTEALSTFDTCTVVEAMGRNAGWIAAGAAVAHRDDQDAPHLVYVPEIPFSLKRFIKDVKQTHKRLGRVVILASEGLKYASGEYITTQKGALAKDAFGHVQLGGVAETLKSIIETEAGLKCRYNKPGTAQRNAMHFASLTDSDEAYAVGAEAVRKAVAGQSGFMVTIVRESDEPYRSTTGLATLSAVANGEKFLPRDFMNEAGNHITDKCRRYVQPLLTGEVPIRVGGDGLPEYVRFERFAVSPATGRRFQVG
ncbi:MAG: 6-phosphofructokinase [Planctomycetes bacterium]|nr:6-phosphofructokinase [Planctomycetota bacterium]